MLRPCTRIKEPFQTQEGSTAYFFLEVQPLPNIQVRRIQKWSNGGSGPCLPTPHNGNWNSINSCYWSWTCRQIFLCWERDANGAKGSIIIINNNKYWYKAELTGQFASFASQTTNNCNGSNLSGLNDDVTLFPTEHKENRWREVNNDNKRLDIWSQNPFFLFCSLYFTTLLSTQDSVPLNFQTLDWIISKY